MNEPRERAVSLDFLIAFFIHRLYDYRLIQPSGLKMNQSGSALESLSLLLFDRREINDFLSKCFE